MKKAVPVPAGPAHEYARFVAAERRARRVSRASGPLAEGELSEPIFVDAKQACALLVVAAREAARLPAQVSEVVWVRGDSELAVIIDGLAVELSEGLVTLHVPVRCDQIDKGKVSVLFAVGSAKAPAGLFASTYRRPNGPPEVVSAWGEALVAFAWHCLLNISSGIAGAVGRDDRGESLVPVELIASKKGLQIAPMARHRFSSATATPTRDERRG